MKKLIGKYFWIPVGIVIAVGIYFMEGKWTDQYLGVETMSPSPVMGAVAKPVVKRPVVKKNTIIPTYPVSTKSYTELIKEYEGRRIQFDERCQAVPQSSTYKNGTSILLDNRSASARTVLVAGTKYDLVAYGYKVITLSSPNLPKELAVSCGSSDNVGKILLQAQILQ